MNRVWMITGCSTGFGRLLTERLVAAGESVVATARSVQALRDLGTAGPGRILRLPLDVTSSVAVHAAVAEAYSTFGAVDVLVNNAGYGYFATQEEGELAEIRRMYETNVFGLITMTQAVLPKMRARRSGVIVNLSSIAGRIATPRGGFYQSSKWAVEALSEALHLETVDFGLRTIVIEPGAYETDFASRSARRSVAEATDTSPYAALRARWIANASRAIFPRRQDPAEVIDAIIAAVDSGIPFVRLPVGSDATQLAARRDEMTSTKFVEWVREVYEQEEG